MVTGIATEVGKTKDGKAFKRNFRWTDAWLERGGKWQCVASQAMLIRSGPDKSKSIARERVPRY